MDLDGFEWICMDVDGHRNMDMDVWIYGHMDIWIYGYRRSNHMSCRFDRLLALP